MGTLLFTAEYTAFLCTGNIRLVNGSIPTEREGRTVLYEGEWGRVVVDLDSNDTAAARIACRHGRHPIIWKW